MLIQALAHGSAKAVQETALVSNETIQSWLNRRLKATQCVIGHSDLWSAPFKEKNRV